MCERETTLTLEAQTYREDELKQKIPGEPVLREVMCRVKDVTRAEWNNASLRGLKASWCVKLWADEYCGEETAILDGVRYSVYRTFSPQPGRVELYLGRKVGV